MKIKYYENCIIGEENDKTSIKLKDYQNVLMDMLSDVLEKLESENINYFVDGGTMLGAIRHKDIIPWDDDIDICFFLEDYEILLNALKSLDTSIYFAQSFDTDDNYDVTQPMIKLRKRNTYVEYDAIYARNNCEEKGIFIDFIAISKVPESRWVNFWWRKMALGRTLALLMFNKVDINVRWLKRRHIKQAYGFAKKGKDSSLIGYALLNNAWQNNMWLENLIFPVIKLPYNRYNVPVPHGYDAYLKKLYGDYMSTPNLDEVELLHSKNLKLHSGFKEDVNNAN